MPVMRYQKPLFRGIGMFIEGGGNKYIQGGNSQLSYCDNSLIDINYIENSIIIMH